MSTNKHTPGPWGAFDHGVSELCIHGAKGSAPNGGEACVAVLDGEGNWAWQSLEQREADAARIIACANYCDGMADDDLTEFGGAAKQVQHTIDWHQAHLDHVLLRDELLSALRALLAQAEIVWELSRSDRYGHKADAHYNRARAVIAKVSA